jgi:hypothetical protein
VSDELPIADYDALPIGGIESRVRSLEPAGVEQVLTYEREHGNRPQVVLMLEHRLEALRAGEAEVSEGDPAVQAPEIAPGTPGGSQVSPVTEGPPQNPPSQGVPTNPAQPRQ